jgi:hypothetical protein
MRDFQQYRVYDWQFKHVPAGEWIPFERAQEHVNHIWSAMSLSYPPMVSMMAANVTKWAGKANRGGIYLPAKGCNTRTLLHELAHSMTMDIDGLGHQHNEYFVGMFIVLIERFLKVPGPMLHYTAKLEGVNAKMGVQPSITDGGVFYR